MEKDNLKSVIFDFTDFFFSDFLNKATKDILKLNDKSTPEEIYLELKMSKKAFKNAAGHLYKLKKIRIEDDGIHLVK